MMKVSLGIYVCFAGLFIVLAEECKDRSRVCRYYPKYFCDERKSKYIEFMRKNCANTCGFCNCRNWIYKCCKNTKVHADGPNEMGCPAKLCYDARIETCKEIKKEGKCETPYGKTLCPWSCGDCKSPSAPTKQCDNMGYGCCWDGTPALGPNGLGCSPCQDSYKHVCNQFKITPCTNTGAYYTRTFLLTYCPETCGYCPIRKCQDERSNCATFLRKGYCDNSKWKPYLASICAKTCEFCKDEEESIHAKK